MARLATDDSIPVSSRHCLAKAENLASVSAEAEAAISSPIDQGRITWMASGRSGSAATAAAMCSRRFATIFRDKEARVTDRLSPQQFQESEGVADWRVLGEGACAFFRTGSFAAGTRLVQAIGALPGIDDHAPDVDVRPDGVTVRLLTSTENYCGMTTRDVALARQISAVARELGLAADPAAVQSLLVIPGAPDIAA